MSATSLKQLFRTRIGKGVNGTLSAMRHDASRRLIREGLMSMTAVADACGYSSLHYFSRKFTSLEGMTPTEYARSVKSMAE
jgi:AraC-like DNA-binding protein